MPVSPDSAILALISSSLDKFEANVEKTQAQLQGVRESMHQMAVALARQENLPEKIAQMDARILDLDRRVGELNTKQATTQAAGIRLEKWLPYLLALGLGGNYAVDILSPALTQPVVEDSVTE